MSTPTLNKRAESIRHLEEANVIRSKRARLKQHIAAGDIKLAEILRADKVWLHSMQVSKLLRAVPGMGPAKIRRTLDANRISSSLKLQDFSFQRREELLIWLSQNFPSVVVS